MEARQYQRIIEEKSSYDAEEMNILKEILVRRELEKHLLEKEVEAYRHMYNGNEQLRDDIPDTVNTTRDELASSLDMREDPSLMLQQLSGSIDKDIGENETVVNKFSSFGEATCLWNEEDDISKQGDFDNKFSNISGILGKLNSSQTAIYLENEEQEKNDNANQQVEKGKNTNETHNLNVVRILCDGENLKQHGHNAFQGSKSTGDIISDVEAHVHDVHVVDGYETNEPLHQEGDLELDASEVEKIDSIHDFPSANGFGMEPNISRSSTSTIAGLPPLGGSSCKSIISDLRKNSMSAVDNERLKIHTEVEWVREKLRIVQGGREKLNIFQLQLLEDIASQLREIRSADRTRKGCVPDFSSATML